jgi:hypothetical protein
MQRGACHARERRSSSASSAAGPERESARVIPMTESAERAAPAIIDAGQSETGRRPGVRRILYAPAA